MILPRFAAVCFDFDGTLADNFDAIAGAVNHVREGRGLSPLAMPQVKHFVGRGIEYLVANASPGGDLEADIASYRAYFPKVMRDGTRLLPGVGETLAALHEAGKRLAVCSNKFSKYTRELLQFLRIEGYFSAVLGPEDVGRPKPAPDMLLIAMQRLGVTPAETLYVGDMVVDIETARAAGVSVWAVPTGVEGPSTLQAARPERVLESFRELTTNACG